MQFEIGEVLEGKVTGITKFGAFVALPNGKSGLVHISEVANAFVSDINEFLSVGQTVKVKLIAVNGDKLNLSIKKAQPPERPPEQRKVQSRPAQKPTQAQQTVAEPSADKMFEDKLKKFMQESDSRIAGNPMYADRGKSRRRR